MKRKVLFLTGPTASGKTALAVQLAQAVNGEILSVDSRQIYQGMDLCSGKDLAEYGNVPYHLIDLLPAGAEFSVSQFQSLALQALEEITNRHKVPILCGGTGHYLKALLQDYPFPHPETNREESLALEALPREELLLQLQAAGLHQERDWSQDSKRRMARRLEQVQQNQIFTQPLFGPHYEYLGFYLNPPREQLRQRIEQRLEVRLQKGMLDEVAQLLAQGIPIERMLRLGLEYKWITLYLQGELGLNAMKEKLSTEIKRFAKRQMTFLRYMQKEGVQMEEYSTFEVMLEKSQRFLSA